MPRIDMKSFHIGIPCCREEDYDAFVAIFEDADDLPATWQQFFETAKKAEQDFLAKGQAAARVNIDPRTFPAWCESKGCRINAEARHRFAAEALLLKGKRRR